MPAQSKKCLATGCKSKSIRCRGLCNRHYYEAYYEVETKKSTTWAKLIKAGLALAKSKTRNTGSKYRQAIAGTK